MGTKLSDITVANMIRMKDAGRSPKDIAEFFGVSRITVYNYTTPGRKEKENARLREHYRRKARAASNSWETEDE